MGAAVFYSELKTAQYVIPWFDSLFVRERNRLRDNLYVLLEKIRTCMKERGGQCLLLLN